MTKDNSSPSEGSVSAAKPSPSNSKRKSVQARKFPKPPLGLWLILGLVLVAWGFWTLRPQQGAPEFATFATVASSNDPAVQVLASPTATLATRPSLRPMTPVTRTNPPIPPGIDTEVVQPDGRAPGLTPVAAEGETPDHYTVAAGDTLLAIATRFDISVEDLMALNGLVDSNILQVGQLLLLPSTVALSAPFQRILPDSEVVLSPAYQDFDLPAVIVEHDGGFLAGYSESVEGAELNAIEIIERVSKRYSVGARPLLAMLEYQSGWLTQAEPEELSYPMGIREPGRAGLFFQLSWAANRLNQGYYGKYSGRDIELRFSDNTRALYHPETNPGTAAIQNVFAIEQTVDSWGVALATDGFLATYTALFGDPWEKAIEPLLPSDLAQPDFALPWASGQTWYLTGGPHGGWGDRSGWASLDFAPPDMTGCAPSSYWATATAAGKIIRSENGEVLLDLDGDGFAGTGWTLLYMHIHHAGRIGLGSEVKKGDPIGQPSCEGGYSTATHLHIARRYNGQWIEAGGPVPFTMGEWQTQSTSITYDGHLKRAEEMREACECRSDEINGLTAP